MRRSLDPMLSTRVLPTGASSIEFRGTMFVPKVLCEAICQIVFFDLGVVADPAFPLFPPTGQASPLHGGGETAWQRVSGALLKANWHQAGLGSPLVFNSPKEPGFVGL